MNAPSLVIITERQSLEASGIYFMLFRYYRALNYRTFYCVGFCSKFLCLLKLKFFLHQVVKISKIAL
ncbi:hypothetical protein COR21_18800 [Vibrio cholerae]|nr:hypothetical protein [Vibrio cholerae]